MLADLKTDTGPMSSQLQSDPKFSLVCLYRAGLNGRGIVRLPEKLTWFGCILNELRLDISTQLASPLIGTPEERMD